MTAPALYVYAIVGGVRGDIAGAGLEDAPLRVVVEGGLTAVVHEKAAAEPYTGTDDRVKGWAAKHAAVVEMLWERHGTVLPMTFDVIVAGEADVSAETRLRDWLRANVDPLHARLAALAGKCELKVVATLRVGAARSTALDDLDAAIASASPGRRILLEKKREQLERTAAALRADALRAPLERELSALARDVRSARAARTDGRAVNVLSVAVLVERSRVGDIGAALGAWMAREDGLEVCFYGPWPPYSFADQGHRPSAATSTTPPRARQDRVAERRR